MSFLHTVIGLSLVRALPCVEQCERWDVISSDTTGHFVEALSKFDGKLIAGGGHIAGDAMIAQWNESTRSWEPLGDGLNEEVDALAVYNGELYAGGWFSIADGQIVNGIARWNGKAWNSVGGAMSGPVYSLGIYNGELIASGPFTSAGGVQVNYIARWNGTVWQPMGNGELFDFTEHDNQLYACSTSGVFHWDGLEWQSIAGSNSVYCIDFYNGELIAGGFFELPYWSGGATRIARWDGSHWYPLGTGMNGSVLDLTVLNGELIAGGYFTVAGGVPANKIARWDGQSWAAFGGPLETNSSGNTHEFLVDGAVLNVAGIFGNGEKEPVITVVARWQDCSACLADITTDQAVNTQDLLAVINGWGECPPDPPWCSPDLLPNYVINFGDLGNVIASWGACPQQSIGCFGDIAPCGGDGLVNAQDLLKVMNSWGPWTPPPPPPCPGDISHDGKVNSADLLMVINAWGPCS